MSPVCDDDEEVIDTSEAEENETCELIDSLLGIDGKAGLFALGVPVGVMEVPSSDVSSVGAVCKF